MGRNPKAAAQKAPQLEEVCAPCLPTSRAATSSPRSCGAESCVPPSAQVDGDDISSEDEEIESSGDDEEGDEEEGAPMDADGAQVRRVPGPCQAAPDDG